MIDIILISLCFCNNYIGEPCTMYITGTWYMGSPACILQKQRLIKLYQSL